MIPKIEVEYEDAEGLEGVERLVVRYHEPFPELLKDPANRFVAPHQARPVCEDVRGQAEYDVKGFLLNEARAGRLYKAGDAWCWVVPQPKKDFTTDDRIEHDTRWWLLGLELGHFDNKTLDV